MTTGLSSVIVVRAPIYVMNYIYGYWMTAPSIGYSSLD